MILSLYSINREMWINQEMALVLVEIFLFFSTELTHITSYNWVDKDHELWGFPTQKIITKPTKIVFFFSTDMGIEMNMLLLHADALPSLFGFTKQNLQLADLQFWNTAPHAICLSFN